VVSSSGLTTEVLAWKAFSANNSSCPDSPGSFVMSNELVLSTNVDKSLNQNLISSGNLLDQSVGAFPNPGDGYCLQ
jgi:hypothetical protein